MTLPVVHHPDYQAPLPPRHRFPMGKYAAVMEALVAEGLAGPGSIVTPDPASAALIAGAHDPAYVAAVFDGTLDAAAQRRIGVPLTPELARRARLAAAGTLCAARLALIHGIACNTAGGSHHAHAGFGAGFCVFNDVAVAARALLGEGAVAQVLVVDLDVHQGDGTAALFAGEPAVFTYSMHCEANFPVRKQVSDLDIGLAAGTGDGAYLDALDQVLVPLIASLRPDLVFYNAGVDVHQSDRLGRLALTDAGLAAREARVLGACKAAGVPVVTVLGGGYGEDIAAIAARHVTVFRTAAALFTC